MKIKLLFSVSIVLLTAMQFTGCSRENDSTNSPVISTALIGTFVDAYVENIVYRTPTYSGRTNNKGEFKFHDGETVVFSIGDIELPATLAKIVVTPLDLMVYR